MEFCDMKKLSIKEWSVEERPREKSIELGFSSLTDAELLAILLGSGTKELSAVDLARFILKEISLEKMAKSSIKELCELPGIGLAKATTILAAFELSKRKNERYYKKQVFNSIETAGQFFKNKLQDLGHEQFWVIYLNNAHEMIHEAMIGKGGITSSAVDPRIIFKMALEHSATAIIIAHNHPAGTLVPSKNDIAVTSKIKEMGKLMDIQLLDHIIVSKFGYYSFAEHQQI
ncbi:MAG: DNA repair protein RadC [Bacteroidia bacterium]|nr:MAG: DNA repair protein RadC [Bacteroidia bacterium]